MKKPKVKVFAVNDVVVHCQTGKKLRIIARCNKLPGFWALRPDSENPEYLTDWILKHQYKVHDFRLTPPVAASKLSAADAAKAKAFLTEQLKAKGAFPK